MAREAQAIRNRTHPTPVHLRPPGGLRWQRLTATNSSIAWTTASTVSPTSPPLTLPTGRRSCTPLTSGNRSSAIWSWATPKNRPCSTPSLLRPPLLSATCGRRNDERAPPPMPGHGRPASRTPLRPPHHRPAVRPRVGPVVRSTGVARGTSGNEGPMSDTPTTADDRLVAVLQDAARILYRAEAEAIIAALRNSPDALADLNGGEPVASLIGKMAATIANLNTDHEANTVDAV